MKQIKPPYYMTAQLLAELLNCDIRAAMDRLTIIRKYHNKLPRAYTTLKEYCDYEQTQLADLEDYFRRTQGDTYIPPAPTTFSKKPQEEMTTKKPGLKNKGK